jgi:hypothetical protein
LFPVCAGQIGRWKMLIALSEIVASVVGKVCGHQKRCRRTRRFPQESGQPLIGNYMRL